MKASKVRITAIFNNIKITDAEVQIGDDEQAAIRRSFELWYPRMTDRTSGNFRFNVPQGITFADLTFQRTPFIDTRSGRIYGKPKQITF